MTSLASQPGNSPADIVPAKKALRLRVRQLRSALPPRERELASQRILQQILQREAYQRARVLHTYVSWQDEVDTHQLIRAALHAGRLVAVPKVRRESHMLAHFFIGSFEALAPGTLGILEPSEEKGAKQAVTPDNIDLVIVPGLAFDRQGNRLGYGAGYYDRFLAEITALKIGVAFAVQIVEEVPVAPYDQRVDLIVTENEVISSQK
jgi:5-formyltetrahydrofolate cyclo-ligase